MPWSTHPLRTLLLVLAAACLGVLFGLGAASVSEALDPAQVQELGDPVVFDPAAVTVTPTPTQAPNLRPTPRSTLKPTLKPTLDPVPYPREVVPAPPSPADDDENDDDDDDDDDVDVDDDDDVDPDKLG